MPLARKLRKKKLYRRLLFCAFQADDNKLQAYLHLQELVFIKERSPGSLVRCFQLFCSMRSLDAHGSVQKKKMKLQAMKK